jgi:hypothetical protein
LASVAVRTAAAASANAWLSGAAFIVGGTGAADAAGAPAAASAAEPMVTDASAPPAHFIPRMSSVSIRA